MTFQLNLLQRKAISALSCFCSVTNLIAFHYQTVVTSPFFRTRTLRNSHKQAFLYIRIDVQIITFYIELYFEAFNIFSTAGDDEVTGRPRVLNELTPVGKIIMKYYANLFQKKIFLTILESLKTNLSTNVRTDFLLF